MNRTEPHINSTQYANIAMDEGLRRFAEVSHLSLAHIQRSLSNPKSPLIAIYEIYQTFLQTEQQLQTLFNEVDAKKAQLDNRQKQMHAELKSIISPNQKIKDYVEEQDRIIDAAREKLLSLENKYRQIQKKNQALNLRRIEETSAFAERYAADRDIVRQAFYDGGYSQFTEDNVNLTLAYLSNIREQ